MNVSVFIYFQDCIHAKDHENVRQEAETLIPRYDTSLRDT